MRDMKFYIFNKNHEPLCWYDKALEFDTFKAAALFLGELDEDFAEEAVVSECIFYYDGGYLNATNMTINDAGELVERGESK